MSAPNKRLSDKSFEVDAERLLVWMASTPIPPSATVGSWGRHLVIEKGNPDVASFPGTTQGLIDAAADAAAKTTGMIVVAVGDFGTDASTWSWPHSWGLQAFANSVIIYGESTPAGDFVAKGITFRKTASSASAVVALNGPASTYAAILNDCGCHATNSGAGNAYGFQGAAGDVEAWNCGISGTASGGGDGYGIAEGSGAIYMEGGHLQGSTAPSDTAGSSTIYAAGAELSSGALTVTAEAGSTVSGLSVGTWYAIENTGGPWRTNSWAGDYRYSYALSNDSGATWSNDGSTDEVTLPAWGAHKEAVDANHDRIFFQATTTSIKIRVNDRTGLFGDNSGALSWSLKEATVTEAASNLITNAVRMDPVVGEPAQGDRSVWNALNYQARHANDIDNVLGIHHTLGQGAGQAAPGNHTHGAIIDYIEANVTNPPTEDELETAIGDPATVGAGATYHLTDTDTERPYLASSDGAAFKIAPLVSPRIQGVITVADVSAAWTWFIDPRAFYYNGKTYFGYVDNSGNIKVHTYNNLTKETSAAFTLKAALNIDDHANPSLLMRDSDKRILAFYSAHGGNTIYQRISTNPEDVSAWGAEASLDASLGGTAYTYPNPIQLLGEIDDPIWLFYRDPLDVNTTSFYYSKSTDGGATWSAGTKFLEVSGRGAYIRIIPNGDDRFEVAFSDGHPMYDANVGIYHLYYQAGSWYQTDGTLISGSLPHSSSDATLIHDGTVRTSWIWDVAIDSTGKPYVVYTTYVSTSDHRYNYARWTGSAWDAHEITAGGGYLYAAESYYSGGVVLDQEDPRIVYLSKVVTGQWEIYKYVTPDGGTTWLDFAITSASSGKQIRPVAVRNHAANLKFLWLSGTYTSYVSFDMDILGSAR